MINYENLLKAANAGDEELQDFLREELVKPCFDGADSCDLEYQINKTVDSDRSLLKPSLVTIKRYSVIKTSETVYNAHIHVQYKDTLPSVKDGVFLKSNVSVVLRAEIDPHATVVDGIVFVNPYERV